MIGTVLTVALTAGYVMMADETAVVELEGVNAEASIETALIVGADDPEDDIPDPEPEKIEADPVEEMDDPDPVEVQSDPVEIQSDPAVTAPAVSYEVDLLNRLVEAEATGESYAGRVAVAEVVLNRVNSSIFPNSIEGVIYDAGQFSPITDGRINMTASQSSKDAVQEALSGSNYTGGALYFYNPAVTGYIGWFEAMETTAIIGNHHFKR